MRKSLYLIGFLLMMASAWAQDVEFYSIEAYFQDIVDHPDERSSRELYQNLKKINPSIREFEQALRSLDADTVGRLLEKGEVDVNTTLFMENERSPYHIIGMHEVNQTSESIKVRINTYGLAAYAEYMTTPLVLVSSLVVQNQEESKKQVATLKVLMDYALLKTQSLAQISNTSDWFGRLPLLKAAENRNTELMQVLLADGANPNLAITKTYPAMDDLFYNMDVDSALQTCLYGKLGLGKAYIPKNRETERAIACIELLLENEADVNQFNLFGETILHSAACAGEEAIVELLINYDADIDLLAMAPGIEGADWGNATGAPKRLVPKMTQDNRDFEPVDYLNYGRKTFRQQYKKQQGIPSFVPYCMIKKPEEIKQKYQGYRAIKQKLNQQN